MLSKPRSLGEFNPPAQTVPCGFPLGRSAGEYGQEPRRREGPRAARRPLASAFILKQNGFRLRHFDINISQETEDDLHKGGTVKHMVVACSVFKSMLFSLSLIMST